jgi:hypothetical protein
MVLHRWLVRKKKKSKSWFRGYQKTSAEIFNHELGAVGSSSSPSNTWIGSTVHTRCIGSCGLLCATGQSGICRRRSSSTAGGGQVVGRGQRGEAGAGPRRRRAGWGTGPSADVVGRRGEMRAARTRNRRGSLLWLAIRAGFWARICLGIASNWSIVPLIIWKAVLFNFNDFCSIWLVLFGMVYVLKRFFKI